MSWSWYSQLSDAFKKRAGRYLINRYLGPFLEEGILLHQLSVDGPIRLRNVSLNTSYINSVLDDAKVPLELIDGYIRELSVLVPWANLLSDHCLFEISGLTLSLQVKRRPNPSQINASIFYSMCESFSSLNVAEDCLRQNDVTDSPGKSPSSPSLDTDSSVYGVELLAEAIDSIIMRVQVVLIDTTFRLEYVPTLAPKGLALEIRIGRLQYCGDESCQKDNVMKSSLLKKLFFQDVHLFTDEFSFRRSANESDEHDGLADEFRGREDRQPLRFATLTGKHELIMRFGDTNHFGLPRSLEQVEVNMAGALLHLFPHQIHTVAEVCSALAGSLLYDAATSGASLPNHNREPPPGLDRVLQQSMVLPSAHTHLGAAWSGHMDDDLGSRSTEFLPMPRAGSVKKEKATSEASPAPRVVLKMAHLISVFLEKDDLCQNLSGELSRSAVLDRMHEMVSKFFSQALTEVKEFSAKKLLDSDRMLKLGESISRLSESSSHFRTMCAPITVVYEAGSQDHCFCPEVSTKLCVTVGLMCLHESVCQPQGIHTSPIITFRSSHSSPASSALLHHSPDVSLVYKLSTQEDGSSNTTLAITLNSCHIRFDPGLVDRSYVLLYYSDFDPCCLTTPQDISSNGGLYHHDLDADGSDASLSRKTTFSLNVTAPDLVIDFSVPKVDMRNPPEITEADLVQAFWCRSVHPELFQLELTDFELRLRRQDFLSSPLVLRLAAIDRFSLHFQESSHTDKMTLLVVRKSAKLDKPAAVINITLQTDVDEVKVQQRGYSEERTENSFGGSTSEHQWPNENLHASIRRALEFGSTRNNMSLELQLDDLSLVLPNKRVYELLYNRLGNDLLLWTPMVLRIKKFIFNQDRPDWLRQSDAEFFTCESGTGQQRYLASATTSQPELMMTMSHSMEDAGVFLSLFPKKSAKGSLISIHTDSFVSFRLNQGCAAICSDMDSSGCHQVLSTSLQNFQLRCSVGLDREPEICLLGVCVAKAKVACSKRASSTMSLIGLHFEAQETSSQPSSCLILDSSRFTSRAWPLSLSESPADMMQLSSKILFNAKSNLKRIDLCLTLSESSLRCNMQSPPQLAWLMDFFTVVEFPVTGYSPPAVLTEMHLDLKRCSLDLSHSLGEVSLALGLVRLNSKLLDTGTDVIIDLNVEDGGLYVSTVHMDHATSCICIADLDLLVLKIVLREHPSPELDVSASCNLLRLRTCADSLTHLSDMLSTVILQQPLLSESAPEELVADAEVRLTPEEEDIVPDLADAMAELESEMKDGGGGVRRHHASRPLQKGAQIFFFPDENNRPRLPDHESDTMYVSRVQNDASDDSFDDFCFIDSICGGSKAQAPSGECWVQQLDAEPIVFMENHFGVPSKSIDYLRTPRCFPKFQSRITVKDLSVVWQLYGGKDLTPDTAFTILDGNSGASKVEPSRGASTGVPNAEQLKLRGGPHRNGSQMIEMYLSKVSCQHELFPEQCAQASRQVLVVKSFEVRDRLQSSSINKLLHLYSSRMKPRQSHANMLSFKCVRLRPEPQLPHQEEVNISLSLQPIRINIDQDTLFFLIDFFSSLFPVLLLAEKQQTSPLLFEASASASVLYTSKGDTVEIQPDNCEEVKEECPELSTRGQAVSLKAAPSRRQLYIRSFLFTRDVPIRIDYSSKYLDLSQGTLAGLLTGLTSLNCSELTLKKVHYTNGIVGLDKLLSLLITDWLTDIRKNQIPNILGGVGPMYSVLQLFQGIKDLFLMPVEQYQKDGRLVRGLQKGAHSFTASTAMSLLDLTNRILGTIKFAAELAYDIMSPDTSNGLLPATQASCAGLSLRRPNDMREGMCNALVIVQEGLHQTARSLAQVVASEHARKGISGAVGGILRQVPPTIVRPVILATTATSNVLEGVKSQVAPESRQDDKDKWKSQ